MNRTGVTIIAGFILTMTILLSVVLCEIRSNPWIGYPQSTDLPVSSTNDPDWEDIFSYDPEIRIPAQHLGIPADAILDDLYGGLPARSEVQLVFGPNGLEVISIYQLNINQ